MFDMKRLKLLKKHLQKAIQEVEIIQTITEESGRKVIKKTKQKKEKLPEKKSLLKLYQKR